MSTENLKEFNFQASVKCADASDFDLKADAGIVDFPYGFHCTRDEETEKKIVANVMENVKTAVFICGSQSEELFKNGEIVDSFMGNLPESAIKEWIDKNLQKTPKGFYSKNP